MSEAENSRPKPSPVRRLLMFLVAVFFFVMAIGSAQIWLPFSAISCALGLYTIGPINRLVKKLLPGRPGSGPAVYVLLLCLWLYSLVIATGKLEEEKSAYFAAERGQIIEQASSSLQAGDYETVIDIAQDYRGAEDPELAHLRDQAQAALDEIAKAEADKRAEEEGQRQAETKRQREVKLAKALTLSDDYEIYKAEFLNAATRLIENSRCDIDEFVEIGGWVRSQDYKPRYVYFTYCGGITVNHRIYLDPGTGEIFK